MPPRPGDANTRRGGRGSYADHTLITNKDDEGFPPHRPYLCLSFMSFLGGPAFSFLSCYLLSFLSYFLLWRTWERYGRGQSPICMVPRICCVSGGRGRAFSGRRYAPAVGRVRGYLPHDGIRPSTCSFSRSSRMVCNSLSAWGFFCPVNLLMLSLKRWSSRRGRGLSGFSAMAFW